MNADATVADAVRISTSEAIPLAYALCARLAEDLGVRILAIKGPILAHHGLRDPKVSADVDMLLHPDDLDAYSAAMDDIGWAPASVGDVPKILANHSVDLLNEHWPIGIDLHFYFPGFLAPAGEVFEELWGRRETLTFAGHDVFVTDLSSSAAVAALHHLRAFYRPANQSAFSRLVEKSRTVFSDAGAAEDLVACAQATGSVRSLEPFFDELGLAAEPTHAAENTEYDTWMRGTTAHPDLALWQTLRELPPWKWPGFLWYLVMLRPDELRAHHGDRTHTTPLWRLRVQRWQRILSRVPGMLRHELRRRRG